jgi:hypothetical protein
MAILRTGAVMTFVSYEVRPASGTFPVTVELMFQCADPGPNLPGLFSISCTDTELTTANTAPLLSELVHDKILAQFQPAISAGITTRLSNLIGQTVTI